jgi:hypothetical protein
MSERLSCCVSVLLAATWALSGTSFALAQAGSIGGQIGKTDKSISGDDGPSSHDRATKSKSGLGASGSEQRGCGNFFGTWTSGGGSWLYGASDTVFRSDGTARHSSGIVGSWTCSAGEIVLEWKNWDNDRLKLSSDGKRLNSLAGGRGFSR